MTHADARTILQARAAEIADREGALFSREELAEAASWAGAPLEKGADRATEERFLARRAAFLLRALRDKSRLAAERWGSSPATHRFGWLSLGLLVFAAALGYFSNELGPERRINILSFPLIGLILWNLLVFLREIFLLFRPAGAVAASGGAIRALVHLARGRGGDAERSPDESGSRDSIVARADAEFRSQWSELTLPLWTARVKALLHLAALVLAAAAVAGMYAKGLAAEYRAVWESTFFASGEQLRPFLRVVLGPAAALQGSAIPSAAELDAIHWRPDAGVAGENAARWVHWYALTTGVFVLLPRAVLALVWKARRVRLARSLPWRDTDPGYFERVLALSTGTGLEAAVVPYAHTVDDALRGRIQTTLENLHQRPIDLRLAEPVPFGEEEQARAGSEPAYLLLNFAATPEKELHLPLVRALAGEGENPPTVLLDPASYDRKNESFDNGEERRAEHLRAWENLFATAGIPPEGEGEPEGPVPQRCEIVLLEG